MVLSCRTLIDWPYVHIDTLQWPEAILVCLTGQLAVLGVVRLAVKLLVMMLVGFDHPCVVSFSAIRDEVGWLLLLGLEKAER